MFDLFENNLKNFHKKVRLIIRLIDLVGYQVFNKIAIISILENLLELISIGLIINIIFINKVFILPIKFGFNSKYNLLILIILISLKAISKVKISIIKDRLITTLTNNLREETFNLLLNSPIEKIDNLGKGEVLNSLRNDIAKTINSLNQFINFNQNIFAFFIFAIGFLFISENSFSSLLIGLVSIFSLVYFQKNKYWSMGSKFNELHQSIGRILTDSIYGLKTIKSLSAEEFVLEKLSNNSKEFLEISQSSTKLDSFFNAFKDLIVAIFVVIWIFLQNKQMDSSVIIGNLFLCYKSVSSLSCIIQSYRLLIINLPGFNDLLKTRSKISGFKENKKIISKIYNNKSSLSIECLSWKLFENKKRISEINLIKGKFIVIVGSSGSGKTTLLDKFCGLRNVDQSEWNVTLKERKHKKNLSSNDIKNLIAYSTQETFLFEGTLIENFLMGRVKDCSNDDEEFHDDINYWYENLGLQNISLRFNSKEINMNLMTNCFSGGEIQRLGLMRNLLSKKPVEVYDEPTAYLDSVWAEKISTLLFNRSREKIIIVSSHDPRIINKAQEVIYAKNFNY